MQRYKVRCHDCDPEIIPHEAGKWVRWGDVERLRAELKRANGDINKLCDMNRYLERLLRDARPCIDPARAGHSAALGTRDACNCILCELVSRERQKAALDKEEGK